MNRGMKRLMVLMLSLLMVMTIIPLTPLKVKAASGVDDFVTRCYKVALQRNPDQGGFDFWKAKITNGELVGSTVVYEFIFSKEYEGQNRSDKEFVNDLYTMFMGRAADQGGYDYWCGQMASGMTRKEVFAGFANSQEFYELCYKYGITSGFYTNDYDIGKVNNINLFVERLYKTCLGRLGDQGGQKYWVEGMLKGELTGIGCAANYIKSKEYEALGLTDEKYVENLYIAFMGRSADDAGKGYWLDGLTNKTKTRDQVFEGFANSPEFQGICASYGIECGSYTASDRIQIIKSIKFYENSVLVHQTEYDTNGNEIKGISYNNDGSVSIRNEYQYDTKGNMIKGISYNNDGSVRNWYEYQYDTNGNEIKYTYYRNDGSVGNWTEYQYDTNGNQIKRTTYNKDGSVGSRTEYQYDINGNLIKKIEYSGNGSIYTWSEYQYDTNGDLIKKIVYNGNGWISYTEEYQYYPNGNKKILKRTFYKNGAINNYVEIQYDSNENVLKESTIENGYIRQLEENQYDSNGNVIKHTIYLDGTLNSWLSYQYDTNGNLKKESTYRNDGSILRWTEYQYDTNGNKIKEAYYNKDGLVDSCYEYKYEFY